ncbi:unnamed protein product [Sympodiomycopsis kandeliae]
MTSSNKHSLVIQGPAGAQSLPLDADAVVQAAHPEHPDHHLWLERFGTSTSRRRTHSNANTASASASPSLAGTSTTGSTSKRNSGYTTHTARSIHGRNASSSPENSSDDLYSPPASPAHRPRQRMVSAERRQQQQQHLTNRRSIESRLIAGDSSIKSSGRSSSTTRRKKKKKGDKGKALAPSPPLPPPRVSSSAPTNRSFDASEIAEQVPRPADSHGQSVLSTVEELDSGSNHNQRGIEFPSATTAGLSSAKSFTEAGQRGVRYHPSEPMKNMQAIFDQKVLQGSVPPSRGVASAADAAGHRGNKSTSTSLTSVNSFYPESRASTHRQLSGPSSSVHESAYGSSSYKTAAQHDSRTSSAFSYHAHPESHERGMSFSASSQAQNDINGHEDTTHTDAQIQGRASISHEGAQNSSKHTSMNDRVDPSSSATTGGPRRGRGASLDLLRETLSFGALKPSRKTGQSAESPGLDGEVLNNNHDSPSDQIPAGRGSRIRASLDVVRPKFLTFTKSSTTSGGVQPEQEDAQSDDDMMDTLMDSRLVKPRRRRLASLVSSLRGGSSQRQPSVPRSSSALDASQRIAEPQQFVPRGSRSMDIPRRPVPRFDDLSRAPQVPAIPASFAPTFNAGSAQPSLAVAQPSGRARLSLVGEETEEASDYCDAQNGDEFEERTGGQSDQEARAAKTHAKLEQMLGEAFRHVPGGAIRPMTPPRPSIGLNRDDKPLPGKPVDIVDVQTSRQELQEQHGHTDNGGRREGQRSQSHMKRPGHQIGVQHLPSLSSLRSHDSSFTRSTYGPTTIDDNASNNGGEAAHNEGDYGNSFDKGRPGKFSSFWSLPRKTKSGKGKLPIFDNRGATPGVHRAMTSHSIGSSDQHCSDNSTSQITGDHSSFKGHTMAGLGIAAAEDSASTTQESTLQSGLLATPPESRRPRTKSGTWRSRVSSIASMKSSSRNRDEAYPTDVDAPPLPSLPVSASDPLHGFKQSNKSGYGVGIAADEPDQEWRRHLLAQAVNLSLQNSSELDAEARQKAEKPDLSNGSLSADVDPHSATKMPKRSPFLDVVAAGRKSFSRDRGRPTKEELDELQQPDLPTIHKSLSPALLSETKQYDNRGRQGSIASIVEKIEEEPWDGLSSENAEMEASGPTYQLDAPIELATHDRAYHAGNTRPLKVIKQTSSAAHSRNASQVSSTSGGSDSSKFKVRRVAVPVARFDAENEVQGDLVDTSTDAIERAINDLNPDLLSVKESTSASSSPNTPPSPNGAQSRSFAGKRATLGKHVTPPNLQLSPPREELLGTPDNNDSINHGDDKKSSSSPLAWARSRMGSTSPMLPSPSMGSQGAASTWRMGSKSPRFLPASNSSGPLSAGPGRTSFSMDRDRAPVSSPYMQRPPSSASPRVNLRGAFRKFTNNAVSPSLRTYSPGTKGISSDHHFQGSPFLNTSGDTYSSWDSSLAAAQEATKMLQAHTETLLPSPGWTPVTATHSRPETESLDGSVTSGGNGGGSGRFGQFHNGNDSSGGSGLEDREVLSSVYQRDHQSTTSLGAGVGSSGDLSTSQALPRSATSMAYREGERSRSVTAPAEGARSASSASSVKASPSLCSSQNSFSSELHAFDAMLRAQKSREETMLKNISARTRTVSTTSPLSGNGKDTLAL